MTSRTFADPPTDFERIICGLDASPQSFEAARQALELAAPGAVVLGVHAWNPDVAFSAGIHRTTVARDLRANAEAALEAVNERLPSLQTQLIEGEGRSALIKLAEEASADLISVGSHGGSRAAGVLLGSIATAMIHDAPCSVLVAREPRSTEPQRIVHAADGSEGSLEAARVAAVIANRIDGAVLSVHVGDDDQGTAVLDEAAAIISAAEVEAETRHEAGPAHARLIGVADEVGAAMIISGARGVSGLKKLGSVSERVAHQASCSALIVRRGVSTA